MTLKGEEEKVAGAPSFVVQTIRGYNCRQGGGAATSSLLMMVVVVELKWVADYKYNISTDREG